MTIDAARVESDGAWCATRLRSRPVPEEHDFVAVVNFVPGKTDAARAVFSERAQLRQILRRLILERDAGTHASVDDQVRVEINDVGQRVEIRTVALSVRFEFDARPLLRLF